MNEQDDSCIKKHYDVLYDFSYQLIEKSKNLTHCYVQGVPIFRDMQREQKICNAVRNECNF